MKRTFLALIICVLFSGGVSAQETTNTPPVLTLPGAQNLALRNHPQIAAADYRTLAAEESVKEARSGFFPHADVYGDSVGANNEGTRILAGGLNNPSVYDRTAGGVEASQLITDFGQTANLTASSKYQAKAESQNASATREQVLLQVNTAYFGALGAQAVLRVAQQTVDTRQDLLNQVSLLASNKLKSELDVSFANVQLQQGKLLLQRAQNGVADAMTSLSTALGNREPREYTLVEPPQSALYNTNDVSELVQTALAQRPELMSLRDQHDAALRYAKAERDARLPTVAAVGVAGDAPWHNSHLQDDYAVGGLELNLPIFEGGLYVARQHEAELKAQSESQVLRDAEDNIVRDVHLAWLDLNTALDQLRTTDVLVTNTIEEFSLADARYKVGSSSIVELSQAQLDLTSAQIADANARYNVLIQQAQVSYEIGALGK